MYDYLIIGSGLYGMVCARELSDLGFKVLVIEKRNHLGGNIFNDSIEGINIHKYGAHIFHTSDAGVWAYVNKFVSFNSFINSPVAFYKGNLYSLPFNMWTFNKMWGVTSPDDAKNIIDSQRKSIVLPRNLEEQAISLVGRDIYEILIKGYTKKQWGRDPKDLPADIIKRLPVRYTFDNNYFNDIYQGIPVGGYNLLINSLLQGIECKISTDYFANRDYFDSISKKVIYTGKIDEYFNFKFGRLEYRSLRFESEVISKANFQGNAVVNFTDESISYTRIIEHKHFEKIESCSTVITREFSQEYDGFNEAYYPIGNEKNMSLFRKYQFEAKKLSKVFFGGRLAEYRYYDMHQIIARALKYVKTYF